MVPDTIHQDFESHFKVERNVRFQVTTDGGYIYMLDQPIEVFETLVADVKVQRWLG